MSLLSLALWLSVPAAASTSVQNGGPTVGLLYAAFMNTAGGSAQQGGGWLLLSNLGGIGGDQQTGGGFSVTGNLIEARRWAQGHVGLAHAYPMPFRPDRGHTIMTFTRLTVGATIRVFTLSGRLAKTLVKTDGATDRLEWDVKNEDGSPLASGLYLYVVQSADGRSTARGKMLIVR